jgi:RNA polymerase sigma-70 factor (ECF subfamily)
MNDRSHKQERETAISLVTRVRNGDRNAEAEMVERYNRGLRFLLRRKTRDPNQAEDFLQETWAVALEKIRGDGITDPARLAGYLCGIAKNLVHSDVRRINRQRTSTNSEIVDLIADESPSPFSQTSRAEVCGHVRALLDELRKERDREILNRFYVQEEDKDSICKHLKVDSAHFNRVLFRARKRFKDVVMRADLRSRMQVVR